MINLKQHSSIYYIYSLNKKFIIIEQLNKKQKNMVQHHKIRYAKISLKRRKDIITQVLQKGKSIGRAAKILSIKLSTAKLIIKNYKEKGKIMDKKMKKVQSITDQNQIEVFSRNLTENIISQPDILLRQQDNFEQPRSNQLNLIFSWEVSYMEPPYLLYYSWGPAASMG